MDPLLYYTLKTKALEDLKKTYEGAKDEDFILTNNEENDSIIAIHNKLYKQESYQPFLKFLTETVSDTVYEKDITVRDLSIDCYDGYVLYILAGETLIEVGTPTHNRTTNMDTLRQFSNILTELVNNAAITDDDWWNPKLINENFFPTIIKYIVIMLQYFNREVPFESQISMPVNIYNLDPQLNLIKKKKKVIVFDTCESINFVSHRMKDVDLTFVKRLVEENGAELQAFEKEVKQFTTSILQNFNMKVNDIYINFHNGVYFIYMMQYIYNFATPTSEYYANATLESEILHNIHVLEDLLNECIIQPTRIKIIEESFHTGKQTILWLHKKIMRCANEKSSNKP